MSSKQWMFDSWFFDFWSALPLLRCGRVVYINENNGNRKYSHSEHDMSMINCLLFDARRTRRITDDLNTELSSGERMTNNSINL